MANMYDFINKEKMDLNKKNIFVFLLDATLKKEIYTVTYSYIFNTIKILSNDFNVIIISKNSGTKWTDSYINHPEFGNYAYLCFDKQQKYIKSDAKQMSKKQRIEYIYKTFEELEINEPQLFDNLVGTISSQFIIPALDVNYEILSNDERLIAKRNRAIEKFQNNLKNHKLISHCAFIHKPLGFPLELFYHLMSKYSNLYHYAFCHDTGSTWLFHNSQYNPLTKNVKCYYFIDDKRGVRDFTKFPLTELQDFYGKSKYDKSHYDDIIDNKKYDFIFGGLFPFDINYRVNAWYRFFNELNVNGIIRTQTNGKPSVSTKDSLLAKEALKLPKKYKKDENVEKIINDILSNKLVQDTIPYDEYNAQLKDSLFTIVLKCYYGKYDSLNFRVINSLYYGTIPLIDNEYDIDNIQIPEEFKNKLIVKNNKDIEDKVDYYKNHPNEYKDLFYSLYNYYIDNKYFDFEYYNNDFKQEFFNEFYK